MRVSLYTPTHNPIFLSATHTSLKAQTITDFEWVIVPNSGARIPESVADDDRVKLIQAPPGTAGIGFLKGFACDQCTGDMFVELDHDDLLMPNALERLIYYAVDSGAGFFYSDFINFLPDGGSFTYDRSAGWETYPVQYNGKQYEATSSFGVDPASLHKIGYAPNHVRAWTREGYKTSGGYDSSMRIADDHDLVCRTYIAGVEFCHIPEAIYLYRERPPRAPDDSVNTYRADQTTLAIMQQQVSNKYTYQLVDEWSRRHDLRRLDIGPAIFCERGYEAMPIAAAPPDLSNWLAQVKPGSVGCIRAFDALPYVAPDQVVTFWNRLYEVLAPGGWLCTRSPSTDGHGAWMNPEYRSRWNAKSFWYVTKGGYQTACTGLKARFQATRTWTSEPDGIPYICMDLVALKGQRTPGKIEI